MDSIKRPLTVVTAAAVLALSGAGVAMACDGGSGGAGTYPGETAGSYPTSTTTTTTDAASTTATSATTKHAKRAHRAKHAKRS
jgi:hypothetical protein